MRVLIFADYSGIEIVFKDATNVTITGAMELTTLQIAPYQIDHIQQMTINIK